jgi:N-acetylmuramic acid 6-phosphate etherase
LRFARQQGAWTGVLTTNPTAPLGQFADVLIAPIVGPEVITGSTRMKSGTAQKLVLNMISTAVMVRLGYVLGNRMVNVQLTNEKLRDRAERIVAEIAGVDRDAAAEALSKAGDVRVAVLMMTANLELEEAKALLNANQGVLRAALAAVGKSA